MFITLLLINYQWKDMEYKIVYNSIEKTENPWKFDVIHKYQENYKAYILIHCVLHISS